MTRLELLALAQGRLVELESRAPGAAGRLLEALRELVDRRFVQLELEGRG